MSKKELIEILVKKYQFPVTRKYSKYRLEKILEKMKRLHPAVK